MIWAYPWESAGLCSAPYSLIGRLPRQHVMPQCEICLDIAIEAKKRWSPRIDRESLIDSATRGCPICRMLLQTVAA